MNIFSSSAPSPAEVQRESAIKEQITYNLREALKALQQTHVHSDQPIQSEDKANAVCCVLEAAFLHGLKGSATKKNFWGILQKTTHRNTLAQLNRLGQITTEVGLCRAWLRMALNDGVLESYLDVILADVKTLRYYYTRLSYLRDPEQPGIFKTFIQGLSHVYFQLSYNSSVLNIWSHTPLLLAGLVAPQSDPRPVIAGSTASLVSPTRPHRETTSHRSAVSLTSEARKKRLPKDQPKPGSSSRTISAIGYADQEDFGGVHPATPPNTPHDPSQLTAGDIETIRKLSSQVRAGSDDTTSTNTSQISHPDPVDARLMCVNIPQLTLDMGRSEYREGSDGAVSKSSDTTADSGSSGHRFSEDVDMEDQNFSQDDGQKAAKVSKVCSGLSSVIQAVPEVVHSNDVESRGNTENSGSDALNPKPSASLNPFEEPSALKQNSDVSESSLKPVGAQEHDVQSDTQREQVIKGDVQPNISTVPDLSVPQGTEHGKPDVQLNGSSQKSAPDVPSFDSATAILDPCQSTSEESQVVPQSSGDTASGPQSGSRENSSLSVALNKSSSFPKLALGKSPPLEPELSTVMATSDRVEVAKEALLGVTNSDTDMSSVIIEMADNEVYPTGNSLSNREGWSSSFETSNQYDWDDSRFLLSDGPMMTSVNESFGDMLDNYGSSVGRMQAPTMSEVLEGLPDNGNHGNMSRRILTSVSSPELTRLHTVPALGEEVMDEYEVLPDITEKRAYLHELKFQPLLDMIGTVCTEKGLDMQNYQCKGCSRPVGMFYGKARVCGYDACYYCYECHENDEAYIPARIVLNWDFRKQKVCRHSLKFLQQSEDDPLLNVESLNPKLYQHVPEMADIKKVRLQLRFLKAYLFTCKQSIADELRKQVWPREYYYEDIHLYSVNDILQVATGQLTGTISKVVKFASKHVYECRLCSQKGFICEICNNSKVIYPFEMETTDQCDQCKSLYHKECKKRVPKCPKCERRRERRVRLGTASVSTPDCDQDYALSP